MPMCSMSLLICTPHIVQGSGDTSYVRATQPSTSTPLQPSCISSKFHSYLPSLHNGYSHFSYKFSEACRPDGLAPRGSPLAVVASARMR